MSLNGLLQKYTLKVQHDQLSKFKLADRVTIRKELKQKLMREVQGLRTSGTEYHNVAKVDSADMKKIIKDIKKKLGY